MKKALYMVFHPDLKKSRANRHIANQLHGLPNLKIRDMYSEAPHFHFNVGHEKKMLLENDIIFFQFPFYWYSVPPLLKLWFDEVLELGFAYGTGGDKLSGKEFAVSMTVGGAKEAYQEGGDNQFPIATFLTPLQQTAKLCQMKWHEPIVLHSSLRASASEIDQHALQVKGLITKMCGNK